MMTPSSIPETTMMDISQSILDLILEDIIRTECIDFMWLARTNNITLDEIHNLVPLQVLIDKMKETEGVLSEKSKTKTKLNHQIPSNNSQSTKQSKAGGKSKASTKAASNITNVPCVICKESVSGSRFAVHLEKCMNGGKRGSRRFYESLDYHTTSYKAPKAPKQSDKDLPDPYPDSLVVRIKLKNGMPRGNTKRIGASIEEFAKGVIEIGAGTWTASERDSKQKQTCMKTEICMNIV